MQLKHVQSLTQPSDGISKVHAVCFSPNGKKLAVCTADRLIRMYDENGQSKDKFPTKPADEGPKNYIIRQMAFSPQSDKLAIAQSDNIVFIYKIGTEWGEKKAISNKFPERSSITSLLWPSKTSNEVVYGLADGKVKSGKLKLKKSESLFETDSYVTAMATSPSGDAFVTAHLDGSIYTYFFDAMGRNSHLITTHSCTPFALAWGSSIIVAGGDGHVKFYDEDGGEENDYDLSGDSNCREFTAATVNPAGDSVVLGNFNSLHTYVRNKDTMGWEPKAVTTVENMYSVTALDWRSDGSKIAVGTLCGVVDLYDICLKRTMFKGGFEVTHVSQSQVIVRHVQSDMRIVIRSQYGREILKIDVKKNRYVIATTTDTLLLGDLESLKISEVPWNGNGTEKFVFDNPSVCVIHYAGEVTIVEYGNNEILGTLRSSNTSSHVISVRVNERPAKVVDAMGRESVQEDNKKVAFLLDAQTISIKDLVTNSSVLINHDSKIDFLELNSRANLLLFRDKRRHSHLFNTDTQTRVQLLSFCTYVQWVPGSDVVVAQNRSNLCIWYNIHASDQVTIVPIKGDVVDIERSEGKTEVIVDEGIQQAVYPLNESLIEFGTACDDKNYVKAMEILDPLDVSPDVEAMWRQLKDLTLASGELAVTQRCAAAIGDISLSKYLSEIVQIKREAEEERGIRGMDHFLVRSKLALLNKDIKGAEIELINQGKVNECIEMYQKLNKHGDAIKIAEQNRHSQTAEMKQEYFQYLLDSNQEEQAAELKEKEHDFEYAVKLYLKGGMPAKAARVIIQNNIQQPVQLLDTVATALTRAGIFDIAGEFYERLDELKRALDSYVKGHAYKKAVELARRSFPGSVVELQDKWGDYLVSQKQVDMAINHYIEAKEYQKAIEAALNARQYSRALQLVEVMDSDSARPYYKQLARHYEDAKQFDLAEKCYCAADQPQLAVEMHTKLGRWEIAHKLAMSYMSEGEVGLLYINQAQKLESQGRLREAEKLYLTVKEKDLAINMYKKHRRYDEMIRLVQEHRPDLLKETHQFLAQTLEMEGSLKDAEHHYVEAKEWHSAVNMYRSNELWDDAIRVAKFYGGISACKRVTIALLMAVGVNEGSKYLLKHGLVEAAVDHATENGAFDLAFELANLHLPKKLPDIHLKHALFLEDDEKFEAAEKEFIKANKPKEAIDMYVHQQEWASALRVAENYDATAVPDVYIAQARVKVDAGDFRSAEELYLNASRPELALVMYQEADRWSDALRVAQQHLPHRIAEVKIGLNSSDAKQGRGGNKVDFLSAGKSYEQQKNWAQAIETYLSAKRDKIDSIHELEELWLRAVDIASNYMPNRHVDVALEVSRRLVDVKLEEAAADVLFEIGRQEEAIDVLISGKKFDKAQMLAKGSPKLSRRVDEAYQSHLVSNDDTKVLMEIGKSDAALDLYAKRGDWDKVWEIAAKERIAANALGKYINMRVDELLRGDASQVDEAVKLLLKRHGPANDASVALYKRLTKSVLGRSKGDEGSNPAEIVSLLREFLYKTVNQMRSSSSGESRDRLMDVEELLMATHYQHMFYVCSSCGFKELATKCAITLLKYPFIIPHDKAFYQAGSIAKDINNTNLAFMLWNRYVDLAEAIDTNDSSFLDNIDYQHADAIPTNGPVPTTHYLSDENMREEVKTWVLSVVTDSSISQSFPPREKAKNTLYEGFFSPDKPDRATCIVTGFPVQPADLIEINNSTANRRDYNLVVNKLRVCPWTNQPQTPLY